MAQRFKKWLEIKENLAATQISPQDLAHQQQNGGRIALTGLPRGNRPLHLIYGHSDPEIGQAQQDIDSLAQQTKDLFVRIRATQTYNAPNFQQYHGQFKKYMTMTADGLTGAGTLLTLDREREQRAANIQRAEDERRSG